MDEEDEFDESICQSCGAETRLVGPTLQLGLKTVMYKCTECCQTVRIHTSERTYV